MKCQFCKKQEGKLWFNLMNVCQDCYDELIKRKIAKQTEINNLAPSQLIL